MHGQHAQAELLLSAGLVGDPHHFGTGMQPFECGVVRIDTYLKMLPDLDVLPSLHLHAATGQVQAHGSEHLPSLHRLTWVSMRMRMKSRFSLWLQGVWGMLRPSLWAALGRFLITPGDLPCKVRPTRPTYA